MRATPRRTWSGDLRWLGGELVGWLPRPRCWRACSVLAGQATADNTQNLSVEGVTVNENAGTADFVVKLSAGPDDATFDYATADGAAKAGLRLHEQVGCGRNGGGGGQVTISVPITDDDLFEGAQSFTLKITKIAKAANTTASARREHHG